MALPAAERRLVIAARWQLAVATIALRVGGFSRASRLVDRMNARRRPASAGRTDAAVRIAALVAAAARVGPPGTCLSRSYAS